MSPTLLGLRLLKSMPACLPFAFTLTPSSLDSQSRKSSSRSECSSMCDWKNLLSLLVTQIDMNLFSWQIRLIRLHTRRVSDYILISNMTSFGSPLRYLLEQFFLRFPFINELNYEFAFDSRELNKYDINKTSSRRSLCNARLILK